MTVKEMQAGLRGGLSLVGRRYLLLEHDVDMYVTGSNSRMMARRSPYISRRPDFVQVFSFSFGDVPDGQASMYIGEGYEGSARE